MLLYTKQAVLFIQLIIVMGTMASPLPSSVKLPKSAQSNIYPRRPGTVRWHKGALELSGPVLPGVITEHTLRIGKPLKGISGGHLSGVGGEGSIGKIHADPPDPLGTVTGLIYDIEKDKSLKFDTNDNRLAQPVVFATGKEAPSIQEKDDVYKHWLQEIDGTDIHTALQQNQEYVKEKFPTRFEEFHSMLFQALAMKAKTVYILMDDDQENLEATLGPMPAKGRRTAKTQFEFIYAVLQANKRVNSIRSVHLKGMEEHSKGYTGTAAWERSQGVTMITPEGVRIWELAPKPEPPTAGTESSNEEADQSKDKESEILTAGIESSKEGADKSKDKE